MITVTGTICGPDDTPHVGRVAFYPLSTPVARGTVRHLTAIVFVETNSDGEINRKLSAGYYDVDAVLPGSRVPQNPITRFRIFVPAEVDGNEDAFANINDLVVTEESVSRPTTLTTFWMPVTVDDETLYYPVRLVSDGAGGAVMEIGQEGQESPT